MSKVMAQTNSVCINAEVEAFKQAEINRIKQLSKRYSTQEASTLKVSKRTARWVELHEKINELWNDIIDLYECDNPGCDIDAITEEHIVPTLGTLRDFIMSRIEQSIYESISTRGKVTMI